MNKTLKGLFVTAVLLFATHLDGQTSPITISLRALQSDAKGTKKIAVVLISGGYVQFPCSDVSMVRISVYKPDGSPAHDTEEGAKLKKAQHTPQTHQSVCVSTAMEPGQAVKEEIDIGALYEMSSPGTYHVKAELPMSNGSTARSPTIQFAVK